MDTHGTDARSAPGYSRLVVGVDGSHSSIDALRHAAGIATKFEARLDAICVWSYPIALTPLPAYWHPDHDAQLIVAQVARKVFGDSLPGWFSTSIREGSPALTLIDESRMADLLVVGSRGYGGFTGLLLGSVSSHCAEHAHSPVLIVHDTRSVAATGMQPVAVERP